MGNVSPRSPFLVWFQVRAGPKRHVHRLGRWMGSSSLRSLKVNAKCQVRLKPWHVTAYCWPALFQRPVPVLTAALPPFSSPGRDRLCVQLPSEGFKHLLYSFTSLGVKDVIPVCPHSPPALMTCGHLSPTTPCTGTCPHTPFGRFGGCC